MLKQSFIFQIFISSFKLIHNKLKNFAHNKFYEIVRKIMSILTQYILTTKILTKFFERFRTFFFFDWSRIQIIEIYMKFWTMSECARVFVIIFVFFRCWFLKNAHIKINYRNNLLEKMKFQWRFHEWIVHYLERIVKFNNFVASTNLIVQNRVNFQSNVINAKKKFQTLMNAFESMRKQLKKKRKTFEKKIKKTQI